MGVGERVRQRVLARDGFRCVYCARQLPAEDLTVDHVQPVARGGDHSDGNLAAACQACNTRKGAMPAWSFLADHPEERDNFLRLATGVWSRHHRAIRDAARE